MQAPPEIELIAFDVDGTLVEHPEGRVIWQLLNSRFTGSDEVGELRFRDYVAGRIDYERWVALDVEGWIEGGANRTAILEEVRKLRPIAGAMAALRMLRDRGYRLAVISGTLDVVIDEHFPDHPFESVFTNKLHFHENGQLASWEATRYDMEGKARALELLAEQAGIPLSRCAFVGDHLNDVPVARRAGYSVAFNPKCEELIAAATVTVRSESLEAVARCFPGRG